MNSIHIIDKNCVHYDSLIKLVNEIDNEIDKINKKEINIIKKFSNKLMNLHNYIINNFKISLPDTYFAIQNGFQLSHFIILSCNNNNTYVPCYIKYDKNIFEEYVYFFSMILCYNNYPSDNLLRYRNEYIFIEDGPIKFQKPALQFVDTPHIQ